MVKQVVAGAHRACCPQRRVRIGDPTPIEVNLNWQLEDGSDYGIDQQMDLVGAAATDLVVEQLQSNQYGVPAKPKTVYLVGRWVETVLYTHTILRKRGSESNR
jgi:hypothetical protein